MIYKSESLKEYRTVYRNDLQLDMSYIRVYPGNEDTERDYSVIIAK